MSELGQKLINEIRMVAAGNPDYVYEYEEGGLCRYIMNGQPSCLVGHGLHRLGLIDAALEPHDYNYSCFEDLEERLDLGLDSDEVHWVERVQIAQDGGRTWGEAVGIS
ncbi:gp124 [Mycobacterium phage Omega]|uniref:Uncharacterized protein n=1 Tax=Mycobacterium phage Omega TaxID=2907835 RepID=Q854E4_BPMOM|nr:gp124 [Mycobacterium phage Omega]AAN12764.1 hypothetical protein PBI_OMEGA_124 [Mycobacterium phage Omega]